ncbi:MAG: LysM peptidoglycan-binding domain-containing protein [Deltaproteobacteria bacterium]|nr:LysM peptidoglycan-binding domain-containing protein [Deltaproteobacteria bacterium]
MRPLRALAVALLAAPWARAQVPRGGESEATITYTVRAGDTCASIAQRLWRDRRLSVVVDGYNPSLGRRPHRLRPGMTLRLPRRRPNIANPPDANLTALHNDVEVRAGTARHRARPNEQLNQGYQVQTADQSTAEVTFADDSQLRLYANTAVVILGDTSGRTRRTASARDTTLQTGALRAFLGELAGRNQPQLPVTTANGTRVLLGPGETQVEVDPARATTVSVYRGRSRVRLRRQTVDVNAGFAVRAEEGRPIAFPRVLPAAPVWRAAPPEVLFGAPAATVTGSFGPGALPPGRTAPAAATWHLQLARDEDFGDLLLDARVPASVDRLEARDVPAGRFHARVSAVDAERFEGPYSPVASVTVVSPRRVPTARAHRAVMELPPAVACAIDDAPLAPSTGVSTPFDTLEAHRLRCALTPTGTAAEAPIEPEGLGALRVVAHLDRETSGASEGRLRVLVLDREGERVTRPGLRLVVPEGVTALGAVEPSAEPGVYLLAVRWTVATARFAVRAELEGLHAESAAVDARVQRPPVVRLPTLWNRFDLRGEAGVGLVLSQYQQNADPSRFEGNLLSLGLALRGMLHLGFRVTPTVALQLSASQLVFPSGQSELPAGLANEYQLGARWAPRLSRRVSLTLEGGAGVAFTGSLVRFGLSAAAGAEVHLGRALSLGPVLRFAQVVQPDAPDADPTENIDEDARYLTVGLQVTARLPEP